MEVTMKKMTRRFWAIIMAIAMVVTSITFTGVQTSAAIADDVANANYNIALNKLASSNYVFGNEGNLSLLTDGKTNTGRVYPNAKANGSYTIDLDDYYTVASIDKIAFYYNETNAETYPSKTDGLILSYSQNGEDFYDVKQVTGIVIPDNDHRWQEIDVTDVTAQDVPNIDGVRYVKVTYPQSYTWGVQLREFAVINNDGNPQKAQVQMCDDAADVITSSSVIGQLTYTVQAGNNQEGYLYDVYLGTTLIRADASAGVAYTDDNLPEGDNTIKVVSKSNGLISAGLSKNIHIKGYADYITDESNVAYNKQYALDCGNSSEGNGSLTDGTISSSSFVTSSKQTAGSWAQVDLGAVYTGDGIDNVLVWYRSSTGGTWPENGGLKLQYSSDGTVYTDVATITQSQFGAIKKSPAPFYLNIDLSEIKADAPDVRYVRIYYPNAVAYGAQVTEIGVFDFDGDLELSDGVVINPPADFTAVGGTDIITGTITANEGQEDYKYDISVDDTKVLTDVSAGDYVINDVVGGTHSVSVVSKYNKKFSTAITINDGEVTAGSVYESGA